MKKTIIVLIGLLLATSVFAETNYTDGWIPPRLVDGVWVTSGVSDQVAREYAVQCKAEKAAAQVVERGMFAAEQQAYQGWWGWGLQEGQWLTPNQPPLIPGEWMYDGPGLTFTNPFYENWFDRFYPVGPGVEGFVPARVGPAIMPENYPTVGR